MNARLVLIAAGLCVVWGEESAAVNTTLVLSDVPVTTSVIATTTTLIATTTATTTALIATTSAAAARVPSNRTVRVNVKVVNVALARSLVVPSKWASGQRNSSKVITFGVCPVGRFCPDGTSEPRMCPVGTYSSMAGRWEPCPAVCWPGSYCPDPGVMLPCPANTNSRASSTSQKDCVCNPGFTCVYKKQLSVSVRLKISFGVWLSPTGSALRAKLVQAVADAAGVPASSVRVDQVSPYISSGAARRRLLGGEVTLSMRVHGAERLEDVHGRLDRHAELKGRASVHWKRADRLQVLPAPPGKAWEHRQFLRQ